jgi:hypothetical protein
MALTCLAKNSDSIEYKATCELTRPSYFEITSVLKRKHLRCQIVRFRYDRSSRYPRLNLSEYNLEIVLTLHNSSILRKKSYKSSH